MIRITWYGRSGYESGWSRRRQRQLQQQQQWQRPLKRIVETGTCTLGQYPQPADKRWTESQNPNDIYRKQFEYFS